MATKNFGGYEIPWGTPVKGGKSTIRPTESRDGTWQGKLNERADLHGNTEKSRKRERDNQ